MSNRGGNGGGGRGSGGHRSDQRQDQSSGESSLPGSQSSGGRGYSAYGGRGRGNAGGGRRYDQRQEQSSGESSLPGSQSSGGHGNAGRGNIKVRANHVLVELKEDRDLHQYDVVIRPKVTSKKVKKDVMTTLLSTYLETDLAQKTAYDGGRLYTKGPIPFGNKTFDVNLNDKEVAGSSGKERQFKVNINLVSQLNLSKLLIPQSTNDTLFHIILRDLPSQEDVAAGKSGLKQSADGFNYLESHFKSLRHTQLGLSLNVDVTARPFYEPVLVTEFLSKFMPHCDLNIPLNDSDRVKLKEVLMNIKVELGHFGYARSSKITGISILPIEQLSFTLEDNKETTVIDYFAEKYNYTVEYTKLPAIETGSKPAYLPMELCRIAKGQRYTKSFNQSQVVEMLKANCRRPQDREKAIKGMVEEINKSKLLSEFGVSVTDQLAVVEARVLPPPSLRYKGSDLVTPQLGKWSMHNKRMVNGAIVNHWTCLNLSTWVGENYS